MRIQSLLDQKSDFERIAADAGTTSDYLIQIAYGFSRASPQLAQRLEKATNWRTTRHELRPDVYEEAA